MLVLKYYTMNYLMKAYLSARRPVQDPTLSDQNWRIEELKRPLSQCQPNFIVKRTQKVEPKVISRPNCGRQRKRKKYGIACSYGQPPDRPRPRGHGKPATSFRHNYLTNYTITRTINVRINLSKQFYAS